MSWKDLIESQKDMDKNKKFQEYLALKKQKDSQEYREQNFTISARNAGRTDYMQKFYQRHADETGANLYRISSPGFSADVWSPSADAARVYFIAEYGNDFMWPLTTEILIQANKTQTEMEID